MSENTWSPQMIDFKVTTKKTKNSNCQTDVRSKDQIKSPTQVISIQFLKVSLFLIHTVPYCVPVHALNTLKNQLTLTLPESTS